MTHFRNNKKHIWFLAGFVLFFVVGMFFFHSLDVFAQQDTFGTEQVGAGINLASGDIRVTIANIIRAVLGLLGIIAVLIVLYGGFVYLTSQGNEERIAQAKKILINGAIGLAIILSAFTIVQFVINRLSEAVGGAGGPDDGSIPPSVCVVGSPDYNPVLCETLCASNPNLSVCTDVAFYVKSITPSTPNGGTTGMHNIVVRVLFSHPLAPDTDLADVLFIENDAGRQLVPLSVSRTDGGRVVRAQYDLNGGLFPLDSYEIRINDELTDIDGAGLVRGYGFGGLSFPLTAEVEVDQAFEDTVSPDVQPIAINGEVSANTILSVGEPYTIDTLISDVTESAPFGGVGLVRATIMETGSNTAIEEYYDGPNVQNGSSEAFSFAFNSIVSQQYTPLKEYVVTVEAWDIDSNMTQVQTSFVVHGNHCDNGIQDGDETDIDAGGSCGGGGGDSCQRDADCAANLVCGLGNTCIGYPVIQDVSPMNGAPDNWITIVGANFGPEEGSVQFAADANGNGIYDEDEWVDADIPLCSLPGTSSWNNTYVIASVPDAFSARTRTSIRLIPSQSEPADAALVDGAVSLDGVDDHIALNLPYASGDGYTISTWYQTADTATERMTLVGGVNGGRFETYIDKGRPACRVFDTVEHMLVSPETLDPGAWHQVTCTSRTTPPAETRLYVDGQLVESIPFAPVSAGGSWVVGQSGSTLGNAYAGLVDEIALYDRLLTAEEIGTLSMVVNSGTFDTYIKAVFEQQPAGYWHVNESQGTTAENAIAGGLSANYNNGVVLGSAGAFVDKAHAVLVGGVPFLTDATTNDIGPKPGENNGLFEYNTISRPGICSVATAEQVVFEQDGETVVIPAGATAGPGGAPLSVAGTGFDSEEGVVSFGNAANGAVASWSNALIQTAVPNNLNPGVLAVTVTANGEVSNGVPFTIITEGGTIKAPVISAIDPQETTPESFITILGSGFDGEGVVFVADSPESVETCDDPDPLNRHPSCIALNVNALPAYCGDTWNETEVIAEIPVGIPPGSYALLLKNGLKLKTDGQDIISIVAGPSRPSICRLDPNSGPAPLPEAADDLTISGTHFSVNPVVYFSTKGSVLDDIGTWLSSATDLIDGDSVVEDAEDERIFTRIPIREDGYSMQEGVGQIKVQSASGEVSNSVSYTVTDCRNQNTDNLVGYQCCQSGPDAGSWIPESFICEGETRDAGYVWRFTTGLIPQIPEVIEQCNDIDFPSPTPFSERTDGTNVCVNAQIGVRFSMDMDETSFVGNVEVYTCGSGATPDCDNKEGIDQPLTLSYLNDQLRVLLSDDFDPNTWYRVELLDGIQSKELLAEFGQTVVRHQPLRATRPCAEGTSYCFEFRTGSGLCKLTAVGISPSSYVTPVLGLLHKPPFSTDVEDILFYSLWGKADQSCIAIDIDGQGWQWSTSDPNKATVVLGPAPPLYTDSRATVVAHEHTAPEAVEIRATADIPTAETRGIVTFSATSDLIIDLADPQVVYREPECEESCVNAGIRADFNRQMDQTTFVSGFQLLECLNIQDPNCTATQEVFVSPGDFELSTPTSLRYQPSILLKPNTRYNVLLTDAIKSLGRIDPPLQGKSLQPIAWFFKTKNDGTPCAPSDIKVVPHPFVAYEVGEKTSYIAIPYSSPNQCNPGGQALNPYTQTYAWSTEDEDVAVVTNFNTEYGQQPFCTALCLPKGSHIPSTVNQTDLRLCGNGQIDPGEDCDIGILGSPGEDCTLACLRPGNTDPGSCGNGVVDEILGEQCDPEDPETGSFCGDTCLLLGAEAETAAGACGNGILEFNEACDTGMSLAEAEASRLPASASNIGCTDQCLHAGTSPIAYWCESNPSAPACASAFSVCGNGILEPAEECEVGVNGATSDVCTDRCLLQNVCRTFFQQCQSEEEGCLPDCTFAGSSPLYSASSICGDGSIGIGEYDGAFSCEGGVADPNAGSGPLQIVTAVGLGTSDDNNRQSTRVLASLSDENAIAGSGDYALQCGFSELDEPVGDEQNPVYNNCPGNADNRLGVQNNSCCQLRPTRIAEYPADGSGFSGTEKVCRNTFVEATITGELQRDSIFGNVLIASGHSDSNYDCSLEGAQNNTELVARALARADMADTRGLFRKLWDGIKHFFARLFGMDAYATTVGASVAHINVWCTGGISATPEVSYTYDEDGTVRETRLSVQIGSVLAPDQVYAVMLLGGADGIMDTSGVGIKSADSPLINDLWLFETGNQICKIKEVAVEPSSYIFRTPLATAGFSAVAISEDTSQQIVPTAGYRWEWDWSPKNSPIFSIPADGGPANTSDIDIAATTVPGTLTAVASARIVEDVDTFNNQKGRTFYGTSDLIAFFCERPWPNFDEENAGRPYIDTLFNFSMSYCADAGVAGNALDDLPFLSPVSASGAPGDTGLELPSTLPQEVVVPGTCSFHPEQTCFEDTDCPIVYNMPFGQTPDVGFTPECSYALSYEELIANGCTLYDFPSGKYCRRASQYPPAYRSPYRSCETSDDCAGDELCVDANAASWKKQTICEGVTTQIIEPEPPPGGEGVSAEDILQKIFFFNSINRDVIGLQILTNPDRLSARDWFVEKFGNADGLQQMTIAGYDAVTDGASVYINALNKPDVANPETTIYSNIYLLAINPDAQSNTRSVFEALLNSLRFNINITDYGYCLSDDVGANLYTTPENYNDTLACSSDFDCLDAGGAPLPGTNGVCSNVQTKFFRDWDRLHDVRDIQQALRDNPPTLSAGSYIPNYTISRWPSWNTLGGLPVDPLNVWTACDTDDQQTCWDPDAFVYSCPAAAQVYEYTYDSVVGAYQIHAPFEYFHNESALEGQFGDFISDPGSFTLDRTCVGQALSAFGGACGDGVVNPGEACDPPGSTQIVSNLCPVNEVAVATCSASCTWESGACASTAVCGNGNVEVGEVCDDGSRNGTYGHCNTSCNGAFAQYCGNDIVDGANEFCEHIDTALTMYELEGNGKTRLVYGSQLDPVDCKGNFLCGLFVGFGSLALQDAANNPAVVDYYCQNDTRLLCDPGNGNADCVGPSDEYTVDLYTADPATSGFFDAFSDDPGQWQDYGPCIPKSGNYGSAYNQYPNLSCGFDCQNPGGYCGDGIVQGSIEDCDDGNTADGDACPANCQIYIPQICSYQSDQPSCKTDADCPLSLFGNGQQARVPSNTRICMYEETALYLPAEGEEITVFSCQSTDDCYTEDTYGGFASGKELLRVEGSPVSFENDDVFLSDAFDCISLDGSEGFDDQTTAACVPEEEYTPPSPQQTAGTCGNGIVNTGEICDLGGQNGIACVPGYEEACTYCSFDCQSVLTVDPAAYCGNGVVDFDDSNGNGQKDPGEEFLEACDVSGNQVFQQGFGFTQIPAVCDDKGTVQCLNSCTEINESGCITCGLSFDGTMPVPKLALLNPLIKDMANWPIAFSAVLYEKDVDDNGTVDYDFLSFIDHTQGVDSSIDPEEANTFLDPESLDINPDIGIESSALCSEDYKVIFTDIPPGGLIFVADPYFPDDTTFPFSVQGEVAQVRNEFIYSPAVPPGVYRVVVRWGPEDGNAGLFVGGVYSEEDQSKPNTTYAEVAYIDNEGSTALCQNVTQDADEYWVPAPLPEHVCTPFAGGISVHPQQALEKTYTQSFTIDTNDAESDFGFYVQAVGLDRIANYKFTDLRVEIYEYHEGQDPAGSVYLPTRVLRIKNAAGTSSNPTAKYWHVFNLERSAGGFYTVVPIESIETGQCELKQQIPDANIDGCF